MPNVIVAPDLERVLVQQRGIVTVPTEDATVRCACAGNSAVPCKGLEVNALPLTARTLQLYLFEMGTRFADRKRVRGYELQGELRLHGPWPSYEFNEHLSDLNSVSVGPDDDMSPLLDLVFTRSATSPYSDYLLVGMFLKQAVLTEVWIPEEKAE